MKLRPLLKAKLLIVLLIGAAILGGGTAVFAATPSGQLAFHTLTGSAHATTTPKATEQHDKTQGTSCPGLADAQHLATQFSLSTARDSDALQAICDLHGGTFTGTTPGGKAVSSRKVFGYGEIEQLLTYARYLVSQDQSNPNGTLTTGNVRVYLAAALQSCGTTPLASCLKANIPGYQPGNGNGNGDGNGKPTSTPTPHT